MRVVEPSLLKQSVETAYGLKTTKLTSLKKNVYLVETDDRSYVLKWHADHKAISWQDSLLKQLGQRHTRGIIPFLENLQGSCINSLSVSSNIIGSEEATPVFYALMPYLNGEHLRTDNPDHCKKGIEVIAQLHAKGSRIYGRQQVIPFRSQLFDKWTNRLHIFEQSVQSLGKQDQRDDGIYSIVYSYAIEAMDWARYALRHFPKSYMLYLEEQAQWERQIAHQDVAPHNFIIDQQGEVSLLDYDMVDYFPPITDITQFLNRMLAYHNWSYDMVNALLLDYKRIHPLDAGVGKLIPILLLYPADFFREWLGVWNYKTGFHPDQAFKYFSKMDQTWSERRMFVQHCIAMIK